MGCKHNRKVLYLYREGECTPRQRRRLEKHLQRCASCSAIRVQLEHMDKTLVGRVRRLEIQPDEPEILTDGVMQVVNRWRTGSRHPSRSWTGRRMPLLEARRFRWALTAVAGIIVSTFLIQEIHVWIRVSQLERQVTIGVRPAYAAQSPRALSDRFIENVASSEDGRRIRAELDDVLVVDEEWVRIRKDRLQILLDSVQRLEGNTGQLQRILREPGFVKRVLALFDIQDTREIRKILSSEERIRRILRML